MDETFSTLGNIEMIGIFIGISLIIIPFVFFLLTLQKTLSIISPESRKMPPANVWLMFVPIFNIVWQFIMVGRIADSIKDECIRLNIPVREERPTYNIGIAFCICSIAGFIPVLGPLALGIWIAYWIKVNEFKRLIIANKDNFLLDAERQVFYSVS